jgi:tRNA uridine 5-carboxymethylaminomethyl modification enzyme
LLREDNADLRLTEAGRMLGVVDDTHWQRFDEKREAIEQEQQRLKSIIIRPSDLEPATARVLIGDELRREARALDLLSRPQASYQGITSLAMVGNPVVDTKVAEQVEIQAKYAGYIDRQKDEIARARRSEAASIPADLDYASVKGLSSEVREKLARSCPETLGQAGRIPGVTPAALSLLLIHLKKRSA